MIQNRWNSSLVQTTAQNFDAVFSQWQTLQGSKLSMADRYLCADIVLGNSTSKIDYTLTYPDIWINFASKLQPQQTRIDNSSTSVFDRTVNINSVRVLWNDDPSTLMVMRASTTSCWLMRARSKRLVLVLSVTCWVSWLVMVVNSGYGDNECRAIGCFFAFFLWHRPKFWHCNVETKPFPSACFIILFIFSVTHWNKPSGRPHLIYVKLSGGSRHRNQ